MKDGGHDIAIAISNPRAKVMLVCELHEQQMQEVGFGESITKMPTLSPPEGTD